LHQINSSFEDVFAFNLMKKGFFAWNATYRGKIHPYKLTCFSFWGECFCVELFFAGQIKHNKHLKQNNKASISNADKAENKKRVLIPFSFFFWQTWDESKNCKTHQKRKRKKGAFHYWGHIFSKGKKRFVAFWLEQRTGLFCFVQKKGPQTTCLGPFFAFSLIMNETKKENGEL